MKTSVFFTILLIGSVVSSPLHQIDTKNEEDINLKITNSSYTKIENYPIDVAFLIAKDIWGAGAILSNNWILTTAFNCFWVDPSYISVRAGSSNWTTGQAFPADDCIIHPNYTGSWGNNIALLKLNGSIPLGGDTEKMGFIKPEKHLNIPNATYPVTGWGVRSGSYHKETELQVLKQKILTDEECSKYYNTSGGSFCAWNANGGPCVFDFGAPMTRRRAIVGLYQGSIDCTQPQTYPALYTDVYLFIDWITSVIGDHK